MQLAYACAALEARLVRSTISKASCDHCGDVEVFEADTILLRSREVDDRIGSGNCRFGRLEVVELVGASIALDPIRPAVAVDDITRWASDQQVAQGDPLIIVMPLNVSLPSVLRGEAAAAQVGGSIWTRLQLKGGFAWRFTYMGLRADLNIARCAPGKPPISSSLPGPPSRRALLTPTALSLSANGDPRTPSIVHFVSDDPLLASTKELVPVLVPVTLPALKSRTTRAAACS